jgi:serine/threonine protein phosphatase PrpC
MSAEARLDHHNGDQEHGGAGGTRKREECGDAKDEEVEYGADIALKPGDAILMCSDGFWQYVYEGDILASLKWAPTSKIWVLKMEDILQDATSKKSDNDNYSALAAILS